MKTQNKMPTSLRVTLVIISLLALGDCLTHGTDKPRAVQALPVATPDMTQVRGDLEKRLAVAVATGDAQAAQQWAQALAGLDSANFLRTQEILQAPIAGIFKEFRPQIEAVPALIKRFVVEEAKRNMTTPRMRELFGKFFEAKSAEESIPLVHALVHANADEQKANQLYWTYRSDEAARKVFVKECGKEFSYQLTSEQDAEWEKLCRDKAAAEIAKSSDFDPAEAKLAAERSAAAAHILEVTLPGTK